MEVAQIRHRLSEFYSDAELKVAELGCLLNGAYIFRTTHCSDILGLNKDSLHLHVAGQISRFDRFTD